MDMKDYSKITVVILAGGRGSRISEYTTKIPKPMINIGNKPLIHHIINYYKKFGFNNFIIASGYKSKIISDYFINKKNINVINTGVKTMTGGRLLRLKKYINNTFCLTYGDGISNINISNLFDEHIKHNKIATVTAVHPIARFGEVLLNKKNHVISFNEKPQSSNDWINGGFFIFNKEIFNYLESDSSILEQNPMKNLVKNNELVAFKHHGFWQCMDTVRDKEILDKLYKNKNKCPWV